MRINLHQHTRSIKSGEIEKRNLDIKDNFKVDKFISSLEEWDVGVLAITNHNLFDLKQFNFLENKLKEKNILLLPGIEIDIKDSLGNIHNMNIIVNNFKKDDWDKLILSLTIEDPNNYSMDIADFNKNFNQFKKICLLPNEQKSNKKNNKNLPDADYELFVSDSNSIYFFETTNSFSANILAYKEIPAICGSDCKNIFEPEYHKLPDIRIKIDSFINLFNFFKKDLNFMKNKLSEKLCENITIKPKGFKEDLKFPIYNDVNIIIGPKGSGKTDILKTIREKIEETKNISIDLYDHKENNYDKLIKRLETEIQNPVNLNDEIRNINILIKNNNLPSFNTAISRYNDLISFCKTNKSSKYFKWQEFTVNDLKRIDIYQNPNKYNSKIKKNTSDIDILNKALSVIKNNKNLIEDKQHLQTIDYIQKIIKLLEDSSWNIFKNIKSINLLFKTTKCIKETITKNSNNKTKPSDFDFYKNFLFRKENSDNIEKIINYPTIKSNKKLIGQICSNMQLYILREYCTNLNVKNKNEWNLETKSTKKFNKDLMICLKEISKHKYSKKFITLINDLVNLIKDNSIVNLTANHFIWFKQIIVDQHGNSHNPSSGEEAILPLINYLSKEQQYYFLDEPDKSLDNLFINDEIVERINELAKAGKMLIIVTHNANIAIRTWPYLVIYRKLSYIGCENKTYIGSSFLQELKSLSNDDCYLWEEVSQKLLEGGKDAFNERIKVYGKE